MHSSPRFSTNDLGFAWHAVSQCLYVLMQSIKWRANWTALLQMAHRAQHEQYCRHVFNNLHFSTHPNNCHIYIFRFPTRPALGRSYGSCHFTGHSYCRNERKRRSKIFCGSSIRLWCAGQDGEVLQLRRYALTPLTDSSWKVQIFRHSIGPRILYSFLLIQLS